MREPLTEVKKENKITVQLLRGFCDVIKSVVKLPDNLVKMSVHSRLITRGDEGEPQPLQSGKGGGGASGGGFNKGGGRGRGQRGGHGGDGYDNRGGGRGGRGGYRQHPDGGGQNTQNYNNDTGGWDRNDVDDEYSSKLISNAKSNTTLIKQDKNDV